ncbi:MAG: helix-turn-helix domain-containing protein [Candidatus Moranbacteria bacterium]|nr:helix-turn-helix domain-containing protein [Candidatus Moranbacteria bacterium]
MVQFTRKKIDSLTLGEKMKKNREERRLGLADISKGTKIQVKYLQYLEEGEYMKLPADVYVRGFLRSYAVFMGLSEKNLIKQFEREKGIHKNIKKIVDDENKKPVNFSIFVITPKMIVVTGILIAAFGSFLYLYFQVNNFISTPRLVIIKPSDGSTINQGTTHVVGMAEKDALVTINDQPVMVNERGDFSEDVGLKDGLNIINVKARNKFNKETTQAVSVNAKFEILEEQTNQNDFQNQESNQNQQQSFITAEIYVDPNPTWLSVEVDGNLVYSGVLLPQSMQKFDAKEKISISSGKGKETFVKINGKDFGQLTSGSTPAKDIVFDANGRVLNK